MRLPNIKQSLINPLLDFIYPSQCLVCEISLPTCAPLCSGCVESLKRRCRIHHYQGTDFEYLAASFILDRVITFWEYSPDLELLIHGVKYRGLKSAGRKLGELVTACLLSESFQSDADCIVPIPLHAGRQRDRGFNQSLIYSEPIAGILQVPVYTKAVRRIRPTETQTRLTAEERQRNVEDAFVVKNPALLEGRSVLLVDDVITSGATMNSCARACLEAGALSVTGMGLARPRLYHPVKDE
jgi:ComF family protein